MRTLLLADIHSNWAALSAIQEPFDRCLVLGDIVDYGTDARRCVEWVAEHAQLAIRGNHDHAVAQFIPPRGSSGYRRLAAATRPWHWQQLTEAHLRYLGRLPVTQYLELDGRRAYCVHATPYDPLDEYLLAEQVAWSERLQGIDAELVCVGHTHMPFVLEVDGRQVVNPGSVGQPRDGDPRAAYAIIEDGRVELRRVRYDVDAAIRQMTECPIEPWAIELSRQLLQGGGALTRAEMDACV